MANITLSSPAFFRNGVGGVSSIVGVESTYNRVARYSFVAPSTGASGVSLSITGLVFGGGTRPETFRFYIGTDPNGHINAGAGTAYTGILNINTSTGVDFTGSASILLLPNVTYYLFIFPNTTDYGWFSMELATTTLSGTGGSYSLPTLSASTVEMEKTVTIYTNRHDKAFTHTLTYAFGNASGTIAENVTDSYIWTPSVELARQIPSAVKGVGTVYCTTYSGGTKIGSTQQVQIYLTVPESVTPTASMEWRDSSGAFDKLGAYVQNVTKLAVTVTGAGSYGSSPTGAAVTLDEKAYSGTVLSTAGDRKLIGTVTDSRGRSGSTSAIVTVAPYTAPQLTLNASRCTEDGTADDTGEFCLVTITGSTTQVGGRNTAALSFSYGATTESINVEVGAFEHTQIVSAPSTATLDLSATLSDQLLSVTRPMVLSVGYATMDFLKGGKGIAFGTTATKEGFQCAMDAYFSGQLYRLTEGEKEWLFPPMELGVEYRTAERFLGRPVYACLMDFGALTNGTEKICNHGLGLTYPISISGVAFSNSWCFALPIVQGGMSTSVVFNKNAVIITSPGDWSAYRAYVLLKYVK